MAEALGVLSVERPVVLVLEDVHWSDGSTIDLLNLLARQREAARVLVLATYRPTELVVTNHPLKQVKHELVTRGHAAEVALGGLPAEAVQQYVGQRVAAHEEAVATFVYRRSEGHPLFMVQMTDYLVQRHGQQADTSITLTVSDQEIPHSLRELIEAQVGRLTREEQQVLEVGSVAGAEFTVASVAAGLQTTGDVIEGICEALARRGQFIADQGVTRWPDGTVSGQYGFRHAMYQEVLYQRLGSGRRIRLHRQIGEREEAGYGAHAREVAAELAVHFEQGQDYVRAVQYLRQSGENAVQRNAPREALALFSKGLTLLAMLPETLERAQSELHLQVALGPMLMVSKSQGGQEVERAYLRAQELCLQLGDTQQLFHVLAGLRRFYSARGQHLRARKIGERMLAVARQVGEPVVLVEAHFSLANPLVMVSEFHMARIHLEQALALYDATQARSYIHLYGLDLGVVAWSYLVLTLWLLGYPDQAERRLHEAHTRVDTLGHPPSWAHFRLFACMFYHLQRQAPAVQEQAQALATLTTDQTLPPWEAGGMALQGWAVAAQGHGAVGVVLLQEGLGGLRTIGQAAWRSYFLALLAEGCRFIGQPEEGLQAVAEALALVEHTTERFYEAEIYRLKGELVLQSGVRGPASEVQENQKSKVKAQKSKVPNPKSQILDPDSEAEECFLKAIDIARQQQAKPLELRAIMSFVRLRQQQATQDGSRTTHHALRLPKHTDCYLKSITGSPKALTPKICKRRRRCLRTLEKWGNRERDKG